MCSSDLDVPRDTAADASEDAATDASADVARDSSRDASSDAAPDAEPDAAPDAEPDAAPDAELDAAPDAEPDAASDAAPDVMPAGMIRVRVAHLAPDAPAVDVCVRPAGAMSWAGVRPTLAGLGVAAGLSYPQEIGRAHV